MLKVEDLYKGILSIDFFVDLFFIQQTLSFRSKAQVSDFYLTLIKDDKMSRQVLLDFADNNKEELCKAVVSFIRRKINDDEPYFLKRELTIFLRTLLTKFPDSKFKKYFISNSKHLELIFELLNYNYGKMKMEGLRLLKQFFGNDEELSRNVRLMLVGNKANFQKFFELNSDLKQQNKSVLEIESFIMYELEKMSD